MKNQNPLIASVFAVAIFCCLPLSANDGQDVLSAAGVSGGLVVHLDCGDGKLTGQLCDGESFLVYGLDTDPATVQQARTRLQPQDAKGQILIDRYDGKTLPIIDNLATLVVAEDPTVSMQEIMRVLHPYGVAYVAGKKTVKPMPEEIDAWTHYLHGADNNAVAHDSLIAPPQHMQFLSAPLWSRHHDRLASISCVVTAGGRMFYINDNGPVFDPNETAQWTVTARNAFNGVLLWRKPISSWTSITRRFRSGPVQLQRLLVTDGDRVFVTLGLDAPISVLDAATGDQLAVFEQTKSAEECLLDNGVLYTLIGLQGAEQALMERGQGIKLDDVAQKMIRAIDTKSGETLWRWPADGAATIMPQTLTISEGGVFFQAENETIGLDAATGDVRWQTALASKTSAAAQEAAAKDSRRGKGKSKGKTTGRSLGWTFATLVAQDGVVLSCDGQKLQALNAKSGQELWQCDAKTPFGKTPSVDILVVNGVVWTSPSLDAGRDLKTGEIVSSNSLSADLVTAGHHHRCYRNKATDRYVIQGYRGLEFRDTQGDDHRRNNWIRGICQYGIMPANGMVYIPPHNCSCYPEAKLFGLWTLKAEDSTFDPDSLQPGTTLTQGPAYGQATAAAEASASDWPMHRRDASRSGVLPTPVSAQKTAWETSVGSRISAAVVADGVAIVSDVPSHQVVALDAKTGEQKWSFQAGGPVDSAPTIYRGLVLFGSADGNVYCLSLSDGQLAWQFQAAPANLKTVALQQIESLWPVHGSILIADDTAYFTAGRSTYIDGGLFLYGLDPVTGKVKYSRKLHSPAATLVDNKEGIQRQGFSQNAVDYKTQGAPDHSDAFSMAGNLSDILSADGNALYLRHQKFDRELNAMQEWTHHLFSTSSLLDPSESYRAHWFYGNGDFSRLPVAYEWLTRGSYGGFSSPLGKLIVVDAKAQRLWGATWGKMALYTTDISQIDAVLEKDFPKVKEAITHESLAEELPIHPRAMIKAGDALYLGGYPSDSDILHFSGDPITDRGILLKVDAATGAIQQQIDLPACPIFDGISAANGRLYLALENGHLICQE